MHAAPETCTKLERAFTHLWTTYVLNLSLSLLFFSWFYHSSFVTLHSSSLLLTISPFLFLFRHLPSPSVSSSCVCLCLFVRVLWEMLWYAAIVVIVLSHPEVEMPQLQHSNWIQFPLLDQIRECVFSFSRSWACEGGAVVLSQAEDESWMRNRCSDTPSPVTFLLRSTLLDSETMFLKVWVETHGRVLWRD